MLAAVLSALTGYGSPNPRHTGSSAGASSPTQPGLPAAPRPGTLASFERCALYATSYAPPGSSRNGSWYPEGSVSPASLWTGMMTWPYQKHSQMPPALHLVPGARHTNPTPSALSSQPRARCSAPTRYAGTAGIGNDAPLNAPNSTPLELAQYFHWQGPDRVAKIAQ